MLFTMMSNVSQRFARIPPRKKVFSNIFEVPDNAVVRSGPFAIPKLEQRRPDVKDGDKIVAADMERLSKPFRPTPVNMVGIADPYLRSPNHPQLAQPQLAQSDFTTRSKIQVTPERKFTFFIKDFKGLRPTPEPDFYYAHNKKLKSVDDMYKALRTQILDYIKSKDGIVKRDQGYISDNVMRDNSKLDMSFQRILDGAEGVLGTMVLKKFNKNRLDADQSAALVDDNGLSRKIDVERSPTSYNDTYNDDPEEESPETQELVESLNHLPLQGDAFYGHSILTPAGIADTKPRRFHDSNKRFTKDREERLWAPRKKANTFDNFVEKVTEVNYDPVDVGDQELSDGEVTENGDDVLSITEYSKSSFSFPDSKFVEKLSQEDEALNRKIDQRICYALELFRNAMVCGLSVSEFASSSISPSTSMETSKETSAAAEMVSSEPTEEESTCVDTTCPTGLSSSSGGASGKTSTKDHSSTIGKLLGSKKPSGSTVKKSTKAGSDASTTKAAKDTKKLNTSKTTVSKKSTVARYSNRRNALKNHLNQKKMKNLATSEQKESLSDYDQVFGTKSSRLAVSRKMSKQKDTRVTRMGKLSHTKSS